MNSIKLFGAESAISQKKFFAITLASAGTLAWFFLLFALYNDLFKNITADDNVVIVSQSLLLVCAALSAIAGGMISNRVSRRKLLWAWITLGLLSTLSLAVFRGDFFALLIGALLGVSLGLGYPCCTALLADNTAISERGRISGFVILECFVMVSIVGIVVFSLGDFSILSIALIAAVRSTSFLTLFLDPCNRTKGKDSTWRQILTHKNFMSFIIPYVLFNVATGLIAFVWFWLSNSPEYVSGGYQEVLESVPAARFLIAGLSGFAAGFMADRYGRKIPIITGLVLLGISFALLGAFTSSWSVLAYLVASGIAWGFLIVSYLTVPGDIASVGAKEKFYALGAVVPLLVYMSLTSISDLAKVGIAPLSLSSIFSIILFVSVVPVLLAVEPLPESNKQARKLKDHLSKLEKLMQDEKKKSNP